MKRRGRELSLIFSADSASKNNFPKTKQQQKDVVLGITGHGHTPDLRRGIGGGGGEEGTRGEDRVVSRSAYPSKGEEGG